MPAPNVQPCYHRMTILITGIGCEFSQEEIEQALQKGLGKRATGITVEEMEDREWGDPADLL